MSEKRPLRILVVDDEPLARERLNALIADLPDMIVIGNAANGLEALQVVTAESPDVVVLDVRMPGMDGLETAHHLAALPASPAVVFATAYGDHALAAFEANAVGYLMKPVRSDKLAYALERAAALTRASAERIDSRLESARRRSHLSAVIGGNLRLVAFAEVRCFIAEQKYVTVIWPGGELPLEDSLRQLETEFAEELLRVHRNALVATRYVEGLERDDGGAWTVTLSGTDKRLIVSRRLLGDVRRRLRMG
jgi:two-component system response regulator AlgR